MTDPKVGRVRGRCDTCGGRTNTRRRYCSPVCAPRGGGTPYAVVERAADQARAAGTPPAQVADDLGASPVALVRRFYRHGQPDLARWFDTDEAARRERLDARSARARRQRAEARAEREAARREKAA